MTIYVIFNIATKTIAPKAFASRTLADKYIGNNEWFKVKEIYLDTTVDIKGETA